MKRSSKRILMGFDWIHRQLGGWEKESEKKSDEHCRTSNKKKTQTKTLLRG